MAILFYSPWDNVEQWISALERALPNEEIRVWPDVGSHEEIDFAMVWQIPRGVLATFPNLLAIFCLGSGVDSLLADPDLPRHVPIMRLVDPLMADRMAEYVCASVLYYHLGFDIYKEQQGKRVWLRHPAKDASDRVVALLGLGHMGRRCAQRLGGLGFKLLGWSRTNKNAKNVLNFHGPDGLHQVLGMADISVILLPLTAQTHNLVDRKAFNEMKPGSYLINCSRGEILIEDELIVALDSGHLSGATLDAFSQEPLENRHQFWRHSKLRVTPHIASLSDPGTSALILAEQFHRVRMQKPVENLISIKRGY